MDVIDNEMKGFTITYKASRKSYRSCKKKFPIYSITYSNR